jgi:hypothetical protein
VSAEGEAARALAKRLLVRSDEDLGRLRGVAGEGRAGLILVTGAELDLPWTDGARYLGQDPLAPSLLLPTARAPSVSPALLERALGRGASVAVLLDPPRVVSLADARVLARARIEALLA